MVQIAPKWFETSETDEVVNVGDGFGWPLVMAFKLWTIITDQCAVVNALDPQGWAGHEPSVVVPYHTMSTRPASPAAIHGKTLVSKVGVAAVILTGAPQLAPWLVETDKNTW